MARGLLTAKLDDFSGNVRAGVAVTITDRSTGAPAALFAGPLTGAATVSNPVVTDSRGAFRVWTERGAYTVTVPSGSGVPSYTRFVEAAPTANYTVDPGWISPSSASDTALPLNPTNGQRKTILVTADAGGYGTILRPTYWTFQYDNLNNANRWKFIGGAPLHFSVSSLVVQQYTQFIVTVTLPTTGFYTMTMAGNNAPTYNNGNQADFFWGQDAGQVKFLRTTGYGGNGSNLAGSATAFNTYAAGPCKLRANNINGVTTVLSSSTLHWFAIIPSSGYSEGNGPSDG